MSNYIRSSEKIYDSDLDLVITGREFRYIREACGLTRKIVANYSNFRCPGTIGYWENSPKVTLLQANVLVKTIIEVLGSAKYYDFFLKKIRESKEL